MRVILIMGAGLFLSGCGIFKPVKDETVRHLLEATIQGSGGGRSKPAVAVAKPSLPPYLDKSELVTRSGRGTVEVHAGELWSEPLDAAIARVMADNLRRLKGSANIQPSGNFVSRDYDSLLEIRIERFDPLPDGSLVLECTWKVQPVGGGEVSPQSFRTVVPIIEEQGDGFGGKKGGRVVAMNEALAQLARRVGRAL